jgi:hypothetical protein
MGVAAVDKQLPWDEVTRAVAQAVVSHKPEVTATEAYYHLMVRHLGEVLWSLGAAHHTLNALNAVLKASVRETRARLAAASATTRPND